MKKTIVHSQNIFATGAAGRLNSPHSKPFGKRAPFPTWERGQEGHARRSDPTTVRNKTPSPRDFTGVLRDRRVELKIGSLLLIRRVLHDESRVRGIELLKIRDAVIDERHYSNIARLPLNLASVNGDRLFVLRFDGQLHFRSQCF